MLLLLILRRSMQVEVETSVRAEVPWAATATVAILAGCRQSRLF